MLPDLGVADIFRRHGPAYRVFHDGHIGRVKRRVMSAIDLCRTAALGGHVEGCEDCKRIGSAGAQHMPGEEAWLVGEHRANGERKYYLSNLPADTPIKVLAGAIKARWICEQAHQQLKEELGPDHFEGRSWNGLHRHAPDVDDGLRLLAVPKARSGGTEKRVLGPPPQPSLPAVRQAILDRLSRSPPDHCPHPFLPKSCQ